MKPLLSILALEAVIIVFALFFHDTAVFVAGNALAILCASFLVVYFGRK